jgi:hypothetical protein
LSDHYALYAQFGWAVGTHVRTSDPFGGPHGTPFNDLADSDSLRPLSGVPLRGGERLDSVGTILHTGKLLAHGGTGGQATTLSLGANETLTSATVSVGNNDTSRVFSLRLRTSSVQAGTPTGETYTLSAPSGWHIAGFTGRAGDAIDKPGVVYQKD